MVPLPLKMCSSSLVCDEAVPDLLVFHSVLFCSVNVKMICFCVVVMCVGQNIPFS